MINIFASRVQTYSDSMLAEELLEAELKRIELEAHGIIHSVRGSHPYLNEYISALKAECETRYGVSND